MNEHEKNIKGGLFVLDITPEQKAEYLRWAREEWNPDMGLNPAWHPVIYAEIKKIMDERMTSTEPTFSYDEYESTVDGVPVVHVETPASWDEPNGPRCRIYLNDEVIYENPPYPTPEEWDELNKQEVEP